MHPLLADSWVASQVEAAVAPYIGGLSEGEVAWMRDQLAEVIESHPRLVKLTRRARPPEVDTSGEVRRGPGGTVTPVTVKKQSQAG